MQTAYAQNMPVGLAGQLADVVYSTVNSFAAETALGFGVPAIRGTNPEKQIKAVGAAGDAAKVVGFTVHDQCHEQSAFAVKDSVGVMSNGRIFVKVAAAVVAGDAAGVAETAAAGLGKVSGTYIAIAGAKFLTSAAAGGVAVLEIK